MMLDAPCNDKSNTSVQHGSILTDKNKPDSANQTLASSSDVPPAAEHNDNTAVKLKLHITTDHHLKLLASPFTSGSNLQWNIAAMLPTPSGLCSPWVSTLDTWRRAQIQIHSQDKQEFLHDKINFLTQLDILYGGIQPLIDDVCEFNSGILRGFCLDWEKANRVYPHEAALM